jgi:hypothetical protein
MSALIHKRTFEAIMHPRGSEARKKLNEDVLTSEYFTGSPWLLRRPALMSDGSPNPSQKWHDSVFRTKREAEAVKKAIAKAEGMVGRASA